ncbi:MAG TPA: hypothetical protein VFV08_08560 [Puia sp.]|nr:hypothetical protein [Puia sp.]
MNENISFLLESLFGTDKLEDVSIDQLRELVEDYPAFNAGHYFLSRKMQNENDDQFQQQTQVTALYFNNPFWLQWLLTQQSNEDWQQPGATEPASYSHFEPTPQFDRQEPSNVFVEETFISSYSYQSIQSQENETADKETASTAIVDSYQEPLTEKPEVESENTFITDTVESAKEEITIPQEINKQAVPEEEIVTKEASLEEDEETIEDEEFKEETIHFQPPINEWHPVSETNESEDQPVLEEQIVQNPEPILVNDQEEPVSDLIQESQPIASDFSNVHLEEEAKEVIESERVEMESTIEPGAIQEENETVEAKEIKHFAEETSPEILENLSSQQEVQLLEEVPPAKVDQMPTNGKPVEHEEKVESHHEPIEEPIHLSAAAESQYADESFEEKEVGDLVFEPYHTVDYFASQGIKFMQEEFPTDKFGKQLKSFTEWLKMMKKLPQMPMSAERNEEEVKIEEIAAHSIEEKDVVTEAMAEVLAKQGKTENAIEIYLKLSLLNPLKIAYFAAKIEELKKNNLS